MEHPKTLLKWMIWGGQIPPLFLGTNTYLTRKTADRNLASQLFSSLPSVVANGNVKPWNDMNHESSWLVDRDPYVMAYEIIPKYNWVGNFIPYIQLITRVLVTAQLVPPPSQLTAVPPKNWWFGSMFLSFCFRWVFSERTSRWFSGGCLIFIFHWTLWQVILHFWLRETTWQHFARHRAARQRKNLQKVETNPTKGHPAPRFILLMVQKS